MNYQIRTVDTENGIETHFNLSDDGWMSYASFIHTNWNNFCREAQLQKKDNFDTVMSAIIQANKHHINIINDVYKINNSESSVFIMQAIKNLGKEFTNTLDFIRKGYIKSFKVNENREKAGLERINIAKINLSCETCNTSFTEELKPKKCSTCMITSYCGAECQRADWKKHKLCCGKDFKV
jgi:hypothetical protein